MHFLLLQLDPAATLSSTGELATGAPAPDLFRYAISLTAVIGLLLCALYGIRSWTRNAGRSGAAGRTLQVLEALPLGGSKRICVVRCGDRRFLVGLGDKELCALGELGEVEDGATPVVPSTTQAAELTPAASEGAVGPHKKASDAPGRFRGLVQRALSSPLAELAPQPQPAPATPDEATVEARKRVADELLARMTAEGHPPIAPKATEQPQTIERLLREKRLVG